MQPTPMNNADPREPEATHFLGQTTADPMLYFYFHGREQHRPGNNPSWALIRATAPPFIGSEIYPQVAVAPPSDDLEAAIANSLRLNQAQHVLPEIAPGANEVALEDYTGEIKPEYCCQISMMIMTRPAYIPIKVTVMEDGKETVKENKNYYYEEANLRRWITEHGDHPATRQPCTLNDIVVDEALGKEIADYVAVLTRPAPQGRGCSLL